MRLDTVWCVRDPSEKSELADIVWSQKVLHLEPIIIGSGPGTWERERTAMYTELREAIADAINRLCVRRPSERGDFQFQAIRDFGHGALEAK